MKARFILFIIALYSCSVFAAPDDNPNPTERIEVIGTLPDDVEAVLVEDWFSTTDSIFCQHLAGEAGFVSKLFQKRAKLMPTSNDQRSWIVWRDEMKPGICGWELREIMVYLDSKTSGADPVRASNVPTRIAYVCEPWDACSNTWASNDDIEKPTYHRCKFVPDTQLPPGVISNNPCGFFDEKARGTDLGKYEHHLKPGQRVIRFVISEVGPKNP